MSHNSQDPPPSRREDTVSDPDFRASEVTTRSVDEQSRRPSPGVPVRDVMTGPVEVVLPDDSLHIAAEKMQGLDVGLLPVVEGGRVVGVITDRDITVRSTAAGHDPTRVRVRDMMSTDVEFCYEDQDVGEAGRLMEEKQIRRLLVLDRTGGLAGIVSLGDLSLGGGNNRMTGETLKGISDPHP